MANNGKNAKKLDSVSLVIPLYNNEKTAPLLLPQCYIALKDSCKKFEIILCNDSSIDHTKSVIKSFADKNKNVHVINHDKNLGISRTIHELYTKAKKEYTILFSVDGGWSVNDIKKLIEKTAITKADIVIGKRLKKKYSLTRHLVSLSYNNLPKFLFGINTYDAGSIKIFKSDLIRRWKLKSKSVFFEAEIIIRSQRDGCVIKSIPVKHKGSVSKTKSGVNLSEVTRAFVDLIKLRITF